MSLVYLDKKSKRNVPTTAAHVVDLSLIFPLFVDRTALFALLNGEFMVG